MDPRERKRTQEAVIGKGMVILRRRFALQMSNLDRNRRPSPAVDLVIGYNGRIVTGLQLRTSCERNCGNMGPEGDPPQALRRLVDKGMRPNNAGRHVDYIEIYEPGRHASGVAVRGMTFWTITPTSQSSFVHIVMSQLYRAAHPAVLRHMFADGR